MKQGELFSGKKQQGELKLVEKSAEPRKPDLKIINKKDDSAKLQGAQRNGKGKA